MMQALMQAKPPYFVEILGQHGEVKMRHSFAHLPITLGRSYGNEVILDDADAALFHAVIEKTASDTLSIRELGSQQGIHSLGQRFSSLTLDGHAVVTLGNTAVRVRSADFNAAAKAAHLPESAPYGLRPALWTLLALLLMSMLQVWISNTGQFSIANYIFAAAMLLALVLLWAGSWAFANRAIHGQAHFARHLLIVSSALVLLDVWSALSTLIAYAFSLEWIAAYSHHMEMAVIAMMVFYHLKTINHQHPKRLRWICVVLMLAGSGLILLSNYQRNGRFADALYMSNLLPPSFRQVQNQPADSFIDSAQSLKPQLDKSRLDKIERDHGVLGED